MECKDLALLQCSGNAGTFVENEMEFLKRKSQSVCELNCRNFGVFHMYINYYKITRLPSSDAPAPG